MNLSDARGHYEYHSGKVSEVCRQLGYAGIAVVWIFKVDGVNAVPQPLVLPTVMLVAALALDLLQYVYAAIAWGVLNRPVFRGGWIVKVKPGIRSSGRVAGRSWPQPRQVEYTQ